MSNMVIYNVVSIKLDVLLNMEILACFCKDEMYWIGGNFAWRGNKIIENEHPLLMIIHIEGVLFKINKLIFSNV